MTTPPLFGTIYNQLFIQLRAKARTSTDEATTATAKLSRYNKAEIWKMQYDKNTESPYTYNAIITGASLYNSCLF
jgi:hypothetical protein